jgi:hypothetical protein
VSAVRFAWAVPLLAHPVTKRLKPTHRAAAKRSKRFIA